MDHKLIKSIVFLSFISLFNIVNHVSSVIVQLFLKKIWMTSF
jgi:hypothetical protein